ncbi:MAG: hypothetical protein ACI870_000447 [Crocinitomicaceae bacterium]|jgi:hypothetical protein
MKEINQIITNKVRSPAFKVINKYYLNITRFLFIGVAFVVIIFGSLGVFNFISSFSSNKKKA